MENKFKDLELNNSLIICDNIEQWKQLLIFLEECGINILNLNTEEKLNQIEKELRTNAIIKNNAIIFIPNKKALESSAFQDYYFESRVYKYNTLYPSVEDMLNHLDKILL